MKDLEKIKSEDLGCQVQDANPANFAIEQEVAQLVGATVPAPTEPSADDARELGAQLLVFLRRALTPIQTALRTAVAAIYAHLDSRCTDYTPAAYDPFRLPAGPYDPMRPFVPRTLPNLLTALTAFSARKISNGSAPSDGIPDGTSLARLLCYDADRNAITKIIDDTRGWKWTVTGTLFRWYATLTSLKVLEFGCNEIDMSASGTNANLVGGLNLDLLDFRYVTKIIGGWGTNFMNGGTCKSFRFDSMKEIRSRGFLIGVTGSDDLDLSELELFTCQGYDGHLNGTYFVNSCGFKRIHAEKFGYMHTNTGDVFHDNADLEELWLGKLTYSNGSIVGGSPKLIDLRIGKDTAISINLANWSPTLTEANTATFLQNFREHIALRLAQQPADNPNHLTLTLSQAVFDTIWNQDGTPKSTDPDSVIYQINKIIKTDKHWSVNRA